MHNSSGHLESRRKQPAEWPLLVATASNSIPDGIENSPPSIDTLWQEVNQLDQTTLDRNRYFSLGVVICEFAKELHGELNSGVSANALVAEGAALIVKGRRQRAEAQRPPTIRLVDADRVFIGTFRAATQDIPAPIKLLSNALFVNNQYRLLNDNPGTADETRKQLLDANKEPLFDDLEGEIMGGMPALQRLAEHWENEPLHTLDITRQRKLFERLRQADVLKFIRGASTVPLPAFDMGQLIKTYAGNMEGSIAPINWPEERRRQKEKMSSLKRNAGYSARNLRSERLVCPAANVHAMFPMIHELAISMMEYACRIEQSPGI
jgi:hypothetical protein